MPERPTGERLSAADASNVVMESDDQVNVFLVAGLLGPGGFVSDGGSIDLERLRDFMAARLRDRPGLARFSQRVGRHRGWLVWEPAPPDLGRHVRVVEAVAGPAGLAALCGTLMSRPLPSDRPLWEMLLVPGASASGPGLVLRVHHAMADGVAGARLFHLLFGEEPAPAPAVSLPAHRPRHPLHSLVTGVALLAALFRSDVPPTVLLGPIGPHRRVAFAEVDLAALARAAHADGATLNDALLAAVAGAVAAALRADGQPVPDLLPASIPVALPDRGGSGNANGVMMVPLPTGEADPVVRMARIAALTRTAKAQARTQGTLQLTRTRWGSRLFARLARHQRLIALFVSNVRGPERPLVIAGAPLERAWPVAPIQGNVRLGVTALSYAGHLACAAHVDGDVIRAEVLGTALAEELGRLAAGR